jgi:phosphomannomutase
LQTLALPEGGVRAGDEFYIAHDLRPSSTRLMDGRGGIYQAVQRAVAVAGLKPVNAGDIPTPALMYYAVSRGRGSIMVTGSHIPFDRNGYKLKPPEAAPGPRGPINQAVRTARRDFGQAFEESAFDKTECSAAGMRPCPQRMARRALRTSPAASSVMPRSRASAFWYQSTRPCRDPRWRSYAASARK